MLKLLILASLAVTINCQAIGFGACPTVNVMKNYDMDKMSGTWYMNQRIGSYFDTGKCVNFNLINMFSYGHIAMTSVTNIATNATSNLIGLNIFIGKMGISVIPGQFALVYPFVPTPTPLPYSFLNTDYTSYAVVYTCADVGFIRSTVAWILTRDKKPAASVLSKAYADLDFQKIDRSGLTTVDQSC